MKIAKKWFSDQIFRFFSESIRTHPNASERIQMHPNASERFRAGPSRSEQVQNLQKTCENLRKTCENFAKILKKKSQMPCFSLIESVRPTKILPADFKIRIFGKNRKKLEKIGFLDRSEAAKLETRGSNDRNSKITIEFGMEVCQETIRQACNYPKGPKWFCEKYY